LKGNSIAETDGNKLTHIVNIVKDITREVEEEEANKELGSIYVNIFQSNMIAMSFYDADGMLIDLNQSMRTLCEFDDQREAFFRKTCMFDTPMLKNNFDRNNKHSFHVCQHMYYPEIGLDKYLDFRIRPTLNEQEHIMYYIVTARDVTAERQTDLELRQQEKGLKKISQENSHYEHELRYLLENSNMYVWTLDAKDQQIVFTRSLTKAEYKENFEEYIKSLSDDEQQAAFESLKGFFTKPQPFSVVHHFKHTPEDKWPQWHAISGMPTFNEEGQCIGYFGVLRNIDDLMNAHEQLRKERTRAEASGLMKSAFLANMTHEIRTPLNAIVGFSDLLQIIEEPEDRQEFIRIIRNNCDMLLRLINDILEASNTSQTLSVSPTKVDFAQVFDDICQTLEQRVQEPNVAFLKDNPFDTYPTQLDKGRIQQVVTNFVTNAVKYTHEGHIKVGYREQDGGLYIYCEDTGSGIPKDKQASVFERFVKLNDFVQGTGLGLSICKTIAEKCNGKIGVFSEGEGKGSTFWLWIPCKKE
jgi:signal transduction histidine kinase